jgi:mono/diheme cytochrome c family protein
MRQLHVLLVITLTCSAFVTGSHFFQTNPEKPVPVPASKQRKGNAAKGYAYLTTGDYVKGGIPIDLFVLAMGKNSANYLKRTGINATISHEYTAVKALNGENLVAPNCLQCHAQVFNGALVMGMGNTFIDFSQGDKLNAQAYTMMENFLKKSSPKKYEASKPFLQVAKTIGPYLNTAVRGVNAADRLAGVLAAHRDPVTFTWSDTASMEIPKDVIPSDVPPWWLLKKKNAMFYNGFGRGDFGRFLMASNLLTVNDSSESRKVDEQIRHVLAFIYTLEAPKYSLPINKKLAGEGEKVFIDKCSKCHGKYGSKEEYPNLLIPQSIIKTDSFLHKSNYQNPQFVNWFNSSWFAMGDHPAKLQPFNGYIAPPLNGIWCTAPYLHNGSVPTVEAVLNSKLRPMYWQRNFDTPEYDYERLGWKFTIKDSSSNRTIYNTTLPGYGNYGHYFGDKLSDSERKAVIAYLKTI